MRRAIIILLMAMLPWVAGAQEGEPFMRELTAEPVRIEVRRQLGDIGTQKTVLDTFALRENVVNSLADVLAQNTTIFIKSYGRGTMSTASFRGTAASHTQVTWNGMRINSPMLGMVDLSLIPSYFIDDASLFHGATSVGLTGGGLGGAVALQTKPLREEGFGLRFVQGVGSFSTYDEFLRLSYGSRKWHVSTRVYYAQSDNDFKYTNYKRKAHVIDNGGNIVDSYYPVVRNRNGDFKDLHAMQEVYYRSDAGDDIGLSVWYMDSHRGLPLINSDMKDARLTREWQDERTLRASLKWTRHMTRWRVDANAGYVYTDFQYVRDNDVNNTAVHKQYSTNYLNTAFGILSAEYRIGRQWIFSTNVSLHQHWTDNSDRRYEVSSKTLKSDRNSRPEVSVFLAVRYKPAERVGLAVNLREDWYGEGSDPQFIPAAFAEYALTRDGALLLKASVARNYRFPTLNDLYFKPGGNPNLKPERGFTYDGGLEYSMKKERFGLTAEGSLFDSYIDDWILWILSDNPTPVNIKEVRSYGVEFKAKATADFGRDWHVALHGNYALTRSENRREPFSENDVSIGKQLPYIPKYSAAITGRLRWRQWEFLYKWQHYSERFTTSSNESTGRVGRLTPYYMSDISLERTVNVRWARLSFKATVNNLFDEEYESVLSRPMAGRNFGFFIEITPRFGRGVK